MRLKEFACIPSWISAEVCFPATSASDSPDRALLCYTPSAGAATTTKGVGSTACHLAYQAPAQKLPPPSTVTWYRWKLVAFFERVGLTALRLGHGR